MGVGMGVGVGGKASASAALKSSSPALKCTRWLSPLKCRCPPVLKLNWRTGSASMRGPTVSGLPVAGIGVA